MLPKSVQTRHRASYDFESCYEQLCCLQASIPLKIVKAHLKEGVIDINGDKVRMIDWAPILDTIKINKSLRYIAIRSFFQLSSGKTCRKSCYFKRKTPAICMKDVTQWLSRSLMSCVTVSTAIKCLDLQGVPLRECDIALFARGMEKNISLSYISFNYCQIADRGVEIFCNSAKNHPCIAHISFSGCNITKNGTAAIAKFIKYQSTLRHNEAWAESLRYRIPNFNCMGGIRRITLNSNPMIGDDGIAMFSDVLKDDLWLKALDLQNCGISTNGALVMLETMRYNNTLVVMDVRQNPMIDRSALRTLLGRVLINAKGNDEAEYPWIKEEPPKDPYCVKKSRPIRRRSVTSIDISTAKPRLKTTPKYKTSMAWRHAGNKSPPIKGSFRTYKSDDESILLHVMPEKMCSSDDAFSRVANNALNESILLDEKKLSLDDSHDYIRQLKIDVINTHRKLQAALESEKQLNSKVMTLEVENARLRKELAISFEHSKAKSPIEDDKLLDSIEQSFNKFHNFLNKLHDAGLGSLATEAGLTKDMSIPLPAKLTSKATTSNNVKKFGSSAPENVKTKRIIGNTRKRPETVRKTQPPGKLRSSNIKPGKTKNTSKKSNYVTDSSNNVKPGSISTHNHAEIDKAKQFLVSDPKKSDKPNQSIPDTHKTLGELKHSFGDARKTSDTVYDAESLQNVALKSSTSLPAKDTKEADQESSEDVTSGENIKSLSSLLIAKDVRSENSESGSSTANKSGSSGNKSGYASDFEEYHSEVAEVKSKKSAESITESSEEQPSDDTDSDYSGKDFF